MGKDTIMMCDMIYGIFGAWIAENKSRGSDITKVRPKYNAANTCPYPKNKFPLEIQPKQILSIPCSMHDDIYYPGQFSQINFLIPDRNQKDGPKYEDTPYFKVFGNISSRVTELETNNSDLLRKLERISREYEKVQQDHGRKKQAISTTVTCHKCGRLMTSDALRLSGGLCTNPNCGERVSTV